MQLFIGAVSATTSCDGEKSIKITKVKKTSEVDSVDSAIKPEMENKNEVGTEVPTSTQNTSNQSGSVGGADQTDSALIVQ